MTSTTRPLNLTDDEIERLWSLLSASFNGNELDDVAWGLVRKTAWLEHRRRQQQHASVVVVAEVSR